jgi:outer membrane receptor protein involved in Fe transport
MHETLWNRAMRSFAVAILAIPTAPLAFPQAFTANLTGLVLDPAGGMIPGAGVELRNTATGDLRRGESNVEGRYSFSQLLPGTYELRVSAPGFKTAQQQQIALRGNQSAELNVTLELGQVTETVEVRESAVVLQTQSAEQSVTLTREMVNDLPLNTRNPFVLIHATAGVAAVRTGVSDSTADQNHNRFSMNGGRGQSTLTLVDGVPAAAGEWGGLIAAPSVDSVQEVQVARTSYDAQFGRSGGGIVSLVTKSGSTDWHGTAFEFLRNDNLDANEWANNRAGRPRVEFQRHQFGGNLSGPISRSRRLFFFGGYEGLRQGSPTSTNPSVPTMLQRNGDFSDTYNPNGTFSVIFDPFSTRPNPQGAGFVRDAFPGNRIPQARFDPVGATIVSLYPQPNTTGDPFTNSRNFFAAGRNTVENERFDARVDWAKSERYMFYVRVTKAWQDNINPQFFGNGVDFNCCSHNPRHHVSIGNTFIPDPTWVVNVLIGAGRWRENQVASSTGLDPRNLGFSDDLARQFDAPTYPQFNVAEFATIANSRLQNVPREVRSLQVNVTKEMGQHSVRFGFHAEDHRANRTDTRSADFSFNRGMTAGPVAQANSSTSGNSIASLLLGTGASGAAPVRVRPAMQELYYAGYVQDTWRLNRQLTLNLGLRYETQRGRTERFNRLSWFDFDSANPLGTQAGLTGLTGGLQFVSPSQRGVWDADNFDLAPRISLAYKLSDRLVVRSGFGVYFVKTSGASFAIVGTDGFSTTTAWVASQGGDGINPANLVSNPFPQGLLQPGGSSQGMLTQVGESADAWQRLHPTGYVQNYSFDIQYEVGPGTVVELGYVGNTSRKLVWGVTGNANQMPDQFLSEGASLNQQVANPFFGIIGSGTLAGRTVPRHRLLRPYPQFVNVNMTADTPGASANFNAMTAKLTRQFSGGVSLLATYQWSKAIDNASETQAWEVADGFRSFYDRGIERSISAHDLPHSMVTAMVYQIPVGKGRALGAGMNRTADVVLGGWQVSSIVRLGSGLPLQFSAPNSNSPFGFGAQRPNFNNLQDLNVDRRTPERWFNTAAALEPAPFTLGNSPRWIPNVRFAHTKNLDLNLAKTFYATERVRINFRAEAFNLTNTPQFGRAETNIASGAFGTVSGTAPGANPRNIQFGLKIDF